MTVCTASLMRTVLNVYKRNVCHIYMHILFLHDFFSSIFQNYRVCKSFCFSCVKIHKSPGYNENMLILLCVFKLVTINSCSLERNNGLLYIVLSITKHTSILEVFCHSQSKSCFQDYCNFKQCSTVLFAKHTEFILAQ